MTGRTLFKAGSLLSAVIGSISIALLTATVSGQTETDTHSYKLSGPYTHENLTIFLIHGRNQFTNRKVLTLSEALAQKKVRVQETGRVNVLMVENFSGDDVLIHSGDIVKGGKQDRTFPEDCLLPAHSGKVLLAAFCVEQGRWQERGSESVAYFATGYAQLSSKELKLAAKHEREQEKVWRAASGVVGGVSEALDVSVVSPISGTSLQLALENNSLKQASKPYLQKLLPVAQRGDVMGYAFSINGELNSADVYYSNTLFRKLWPTLLEASVIEAISKRTTRAAAQPAGAESVRLLLAGAMKGKASTTKNGPRTWLLKKETEHYLLFESRDGKDTDTWIHRNYLTKSQN